MVSYCALIFDWQEEEVQFFFILFYYYFFLFPCEICYFALSNCSQDFVREFFLITLLFICKSFEVIFFVDVGGQTND